MRSQYTSNKYELKLNELGITHPKFQAGDKAFIIESSIFVKEVYVIKSSGGFCLVRYPKSSGGYRVRESRLFRTEAEAQLIIDSNKNIK